MLLAIAGLLTVGRRRQFHQEILEVGMGIDSAAAAVRNDRVDHRVAPTRLLRSEAFRLKLSIDPVGARFH